MKHLTLLTMTLFCTVLLTACGGGSETASVAPTPTNPVNPPVSTGGKLIIDSGRGTTNNQDTERVK